MIVEEASMVGSFFFGFARGAFLPAFEGVSISLRATESEIETERFTLFLKDLEGVFALRILLRRFPVVKFSVKDLIGSNVL